MVSVSTALMFGLFGGIAGFIAGIFVAVAHPIYLANRENYLKAKESRRKTNEAITNLQRIVTEQSRKKA